MRRVPQHDTAQLHGGDGGVDPAPEAVVRQQRQKTGMVDMGMGDEHKVDLAGGYGQGLVFVRILALLHAVVNEETLPAASSMVQLPVTSCSRLKMSASMQNTSGSFYGFSIAYF